jgi:uncharacterized damage-inducible protein DinB
MTIAELWLPEFDQEMTITRRVLERVPSDRGAWKPHDRSFPLGHLAQLVASMPGWVTNQVQQTALDLGRAGGYTFESTQTLLEHFDRNVEGARAALSGVRDEDLETPWSLTRGELVLWKAPRREVIRNTINHLVHHRAQLGVYLRLLDVPVPSMYGPSADERPM